MDTKKILSLAGLCRRAGGIIPGADAVISAVRRGGGAVPLAVFVSSEASERTKKQITDKAKHYMIPLAVLEADADEIGHALGLVSPCAVFGVTRKGPSGKLVEEALTAAEHNDQLK